jgi:hypothetical protein
MGSFAPELKGIMAEFTVKRGRGQPFRRKSRGFAIENLRRKKRSLRVQAASLAFQSGDCVETAQLQDYFPRTLY